MAPRKTQAETKQATRAGARRKPSGTTRKTPEKSRTRHEPQVQNESRLFDDRTRRDMVGVIFGVTALVLLIAAIMPEDAVITMFLSGWLHSTFGVGAYILPFFLAAVGATFLIRFDREQVPTRLTLGLALIFVAVLGLFALNTNIGLTHNYSLLFAPTSVAANGGYIGAALAWLGLTLFGRAITLVFLLGTILAGLVVIGFSITSLVEKLRQKNQEARAYFAENGFSLGSLLGKSQPFDSIYRTSPDDFDREMALADAAAEGTGASGAGGVPTANIHFAAPANNRTATVNPIDPSNAAYTIGQLNTTRLGTTRFSSSFGGYSERRRRRGFKGFDDASLSQTATMEPVGGWQGLDAVQGFAASNEESRGTGLSASAFGAAEAFTRRLSRRNKRSENESEVDEVDIVEATAPVPVNLSEEPEEEVPFDDSIQVKKPTRRSSSSVKKAIKEAQASKKTPAVAAPSVEANAEEDDDPDAFKLPPMDLLKHTRKKKSASESELRETAASLQQTLEDFGVMAQVVGWVAGPTVTLYKIDLPAGVRVNRVTNLSDDIALALAAPGVRIFAPIPGTNYVGIEVPNKTRETVLLSDVLVDAKPGPLQIAIGKDVEGHSIVSDLAKMPHLLIGGTTGSGKSVSINAMIMSILMRATPDEVRFIMVDPKRVEFTLYNGIPHLYVPVVTECKEAASALAWGVAEMERRLKIFSKVGARNIGQYNDKVIAGEIEDEEKKLPYIVIIIDELADLMMNVGKEVENSICRIAQLARAAGIHLIVATQRPSANVVTGLIKSNIINRIAFNVASGIDSRVILDTPGAEHLIGLGDLLFSKPEYPKPQRIQGCYVSEDEINAVVEVLKAQGEPDYHSEILQTNLITLGASSPDGSGGGSDSDDPLLWEAADIVVSSGLGSTSNIQRRLKVGYSRAGRIMDQLEEKGVVGAANGSKPREVLVDAMELETLKAFESNDAAEGSF